MKHLRILFLNLVIMFVASSGFGQKMIHELPIKTNAPDSTWLMLIGNPTAGTLYKMSVDNFRDSVLSIATLGSTLDTTSLSNRINLKANIASPTFTGTVAGITASMVGLGNVNNTSDLNKPISTATQTALDAKQATLVSATNIKTINSTSLLGSGDIVISGGSGSISKSQYGDSLIVGSSQVIDKDNPLNNPWYNVANSQNIELKAAQVRAETGDLNIVIFGDSKSDNGQYMHESYLNYLKNKLTSKGPGYVGGNYNFYNITDDGDGPTANNWTLKSSNTGGGFADKYSIISTGSSTSFKFRSSESNQYEGFAQYNTIEVYYKGIAGGGSFEVLAGATILDTINTSLTTGFQTAIIDIGGVGLHTITINPIVVGAAFIEIFGFNLYNDDVKGTLVHKIAQSGMRSNDFYTMDSAVFVNGLTVLNADIVFVYLGVNDRIDDVDPSVFYTRMKEIVNRIKSVSDYIDVVLIGSAGYDTAVWFGGAFANSLYNDKLRQIAIENSISYFDNAVLFGEYDASFAAKGIIGDGIHETLIGTNMIVNGLFNGFAFSGLEPEDAMNSFYTDDGTISNTALYRTVTGNGKYLRYNGLAEFQLNNAGNTAGVRMLESSGDFNIVRAGGGNLRLNEFSGVGIGTANRFFFTDNGSAPNLNLSGGTAGTELLTLSGTAGNAIKSTYSGTYMSGGINITNSNSQGWGNFTLTNASGSTGQVLLGGSATTGGDAIFGLNIKEGYFIYTYGSSLEHMALGSTTNIPLVFGTNGTERGRIKGNGIFNFPVPTYADDTAAGSGGLVAGDWYKTSGGVLMIKL